MQPILNNTSTYYSQLIFTTKTGSSHISIVTTLPYYLFVTKLTLFSLCAQSIFFLREVEYYCDTWAIHNLVTKNIQEKRRAISIAPEKKLLFRQLQSLKIKYENTTRILRISD